MTVFDCTIFSHELDMLEIRLNVLADCVDTFIIIESNTTHTGQEKEVILAENLDRFKDFPIIYRVITMDKTDTPGYEDSFARESLQRKNCQDVLRYFAPTENDIVLMGDLDEIPNPDWIRSSVGPLPPCRLQQRHFYFYLDTEDERPWNSGTVIMDGKYALTYSWGSLRVVGGLPQLANGGWHFSSVLTPDEIRTKLSSFIHCEFSSRVSQDIVMGYRDELQSIHGMPLTQVKIDESYPQYIRDNQEKYAHLIRGVAVA